MYNRKTFIKNMTLGAVALGGLSDNVFADTLSYTSTKQENRIRLAVIGRGKMGSANLKSALSTKMAELVAVCDVYDKRLEETVAEFGEKVQVTRDYKEILSNKDVEAVIIATPDHLHQQIAIDALKAGKHVYCEKPVIFDLQQGAELMRVQKASGKMFQSGSQGVSSWGNGMAKIVIDSGLLGAVNHIEGQFTVTPNQLKTFVAPGGADESSIDWKRFLGNAPQRPFDAQRYFRWRNWKDYTTGIAGDLFVHVIASTHYIMGTDGPARVYSSGDLKYYRDGSRDTPDVVFSILDYPNVSNKGAFTLSLTANLVDGISKKWGSRDFHIIGARGSMRVEWDKVTVKTLTRIPNELFKGLLTLGIEEPKKADGNVYEFSAPQGTWGAHARHHKNFFEAIRGTEKAIADVDFGIKTAAAALLCNQSIVQQKAILWNAHQMKIIS